MFFLDGHDDAFLGLGTIGGGRPRAIYCKESIIQTLINRDGMNREAAEDWVSYNIDSPSSKQGQPIILHECDLDYARMVAVALNLE